MQNAVKQTGFESTAAAESIFAAVSTCAKLTGIEFGNNQDQAVFIIFDQVPGITGQLALDILNDPPRSIEVKVLVAADEQTQQPLETRKMIHVGMADKNVVNFKHVPGRQGGYITQIE